MSKYFEHRGESEPVALQSIKTPAQILNQLEVSRPRYEDALTKLGVGRHDALVKFREENHDDIEYLENMERNLVVFANMLVKDIGTVNPENKKILDEITARLSELRKTLAEIAK